MRKSLLSLSEDLSPLKDLLECIEMKNTRLNGVFNWRLNAGRVFTAALLALAIGSGVQAQTAA